ncbi:MAG TPA: TetR family transcriptional regulator [Mycobacterium sp.]|nr:TetR family transcriptional regulator [Mycobacterium sp.]
MVDEAGRRRERKNAQTRAALADTALRLFLEKGYDAVSVKEIADAVDVSVPTVFNHVPDGKEALMFDDGTERRENLLAAVRERPDGQSVMDALRKFIAGRGPFVADSSLEFRRRTDLIMNTPALRGYTRKLWISCEEPLAEVIATEMGLPPDDLTARAVARYVLEIPQFVGDAANPLDALHAVFDLLEHGLTKAVSVRHRSAPGAAKSS